MKNKIVAYDEKIKGAVKCGTAYFRLDKKLKDFLELCANTHEIIGFEYEVGGYNFGVILKEKK